MRVSGGPVPNYPRLRAGLETGREVGPIGPKTEPPPAAVLEPGPNRTKWSDQMAVQRWEYLTITANSEAGSGLADRLNELGAASWELSAAVREHRRWTLIFKRPAR